MLDEKTWFAVFKSLQRCFTGSREVLILKIACPQNRVWKLYKQLSSPSLGFIEKKLWLKNVQDFKQIKDLV